MDAILSLLIFVSLSDRFSGNEAAHEVAKADHRREMEEMKEE